LEEYGYSTLDEAQRKEFNKSAIVDIIQSMKKDENTNDSTIPENEKQKIIRAFFEDQSDDNFANLFDTITQGDGEYTDGSSPELLQPISDEDLKKVATASTTAINKKLEETSKQVHKLPSSSGRVDEPIFNVEEHSLLEGRELESKDDEPPPPPAEGCIGSACKRVGNKIGDKLRNFADAANDPDTGFAAKMKKFSPKKIIKKPSPADKPNVYFKASFNTATDDWNLKLEKDGFATDARSWLADVGILNGGSIPEIMTN
jgi:hypothetical protein